MVTSFSRGYEIYFKNNLWYYKDNGKLIDIKRPCKKCGKPPTLEGYDACLGYIEGAQSACCGHGVTEPINIDNDKII